MDIFLFIAGVVVGFLFGVAVYWWPLGQFLNELRALFSLRFHSYLRGSDVRIKPDADLKTLSGQQATTSFTNEVIMRVHHDEGVDWFHTGSGWKRARIIQIYNPTDENTIYRVCHLDIRS